MTSCVHCHEQQRPRALKVHIFGRGAGPGPPAGGGGGGGGQHGTDREALNQRGCMGGGAGGRDCGGGHWDQVRSDDKPWQRGQAGRGEGLPVLYGCLHVAAPPPPVLRCALAQVHRYRLKSVAERVPPWVVVHALARA